MWIRLSVDHDRFSRKVLDIRKRKMPNRKTKIKKVERCHREGRLEGRMWKRIMSSVGKREGKRGMVIR